MREFFVTIICLSSLSSSNAQVSKQIKEQFDNLHTNFTITSGNNSYAGIVDYIYNYTNPFVNANYGENMGFLLESYLILYKTTGDKAYLIRFINESLKIVGARQLNLLFTNINLDDSANEYSGLTQYYKDGMLIWAMAHYCYLVLKEFPELINETIPASVLIIPSANYPINQLPTNSAYSYGNIARWLAEKLTETILAINGLFWIDYESGYRKSTPWASSFPDEFPSDINMQSTFGAGMLYLGMLSAELPELPLQIFLDKGASIARLYKKPLLLEDKCECQTFAGPPLIYNTIENSYWWYSSGWRVEDRNGCLVSTCNSLFQPASKSYLAYTKYIEDISHAITTLVLVHVAHELDVYTNNAYAFNEQDMTRFKNMFTKQIFNGNLEQPQFHSAVNGMDGPIYPESESNQFDIFRYSSLGFMPLYQFDDGDGASVYEIIMRFYENEVMISPGNISDGQRSYGLAHTVAAQWEKECVDVTLYNRRMVYDQDLFAKQKLSIAPEKEEEFIHQLGDRSFAAPEITSNTFTIEPNVKVTLSAGETITLESGFTAESGAEFSTVIQPLLCVGDQGGRYANINDGSSNKPSKSDRAKRTTSEPQSDVRDISLISSNDFTPNKIKVFPNPCSDYFQLTITNHDYENVEFILLNPIGLKQSLSPESSILKDGALEYTFNTQLLNSGVYYIQISQNTTVKAITKLLIVK